MSEVAGTPILDTTEQLRAKLAQAEARVREQEATIAALSVLVVALLGFGFVPPAEVGTSMMSFGASARSSERFFSIA